MVIALIEWHVDKGAGPAVFLAEDFSGAQRAALRYLTAYLPSQIVGIDDEWLAEFPVPDDNDPDAVADWFDALNEETTDARLSIYLPTTDQQRHDGESETLFLDVR